MKSFVPLALLLVGSGAFTIPVDNLDRRQLGGKSAAPKAGVKAARILKKLTPQYDPKQLVRFTSMDHSSYRRAMYAAHGHTGFSMSGIKLDPNSDTPGGAIEPPCKDCTVYKAMANFAYEDGKQADVANGVYVHHIIIADFGGKMQLMPLVVPPMCPTGGMLSPLPPMTGMGPKPPGAKSAAPHNMKRDFINTTNSLSKRQFGMSVFIGGGGSVGSGNPFSPRPGTNIKSGYWIGKGGGMQLTSELVNYDPKEKDIYLTLDVEWVPGKDPNMLDVGMGAISADRCADKERGLLHPPKDKAIVYKGEEWKINDNGYFINFTPHIHDGGVNIKVYINSKEVCEARAIYGADAGATNGLDGKAWETISGYTPCDVPVPIKRGDKIYVSAEYDLTKHRLRPDNTHADAEAEGMALVNFIFAKPFAKRFGKGA